jgi:electron transfer flavoprotein alpha subunit
MQNLQLWISLLCKKVAESLGTTVTAVTVNAGDVSELSKYGVDKVLKVKW